MSVLLRYQVISHIVMKLFEIFSDAFGTVLTNHQKLNLNMLWHIYESLNSLAIKPSSTQTYVQLSELVI